MNQSFTDDIVSSSYGTTALTARLRGAVLRLLPAFLAGMVLATCTAFYTKEPILYRKNVAVYRVPAADYPGGGIGDTLSVVQPFPKLKAHELINAIGNLEYKRQSAWGETHSRVFYNEELRLIAPVIVEAMANTGPEYRLVIVTRYDRDKSVLSRMERNSMVIWTDDEGLNLTFGEIREEIPNNDFRIDGDWTETLPISFARAYPDLELVPQEYFQLKQVGGYTHRTWAVIDLRDLADLEYRPFAPEEAADGEASEGDSKKTAQDDSKKSDPNESYFDSGENDSGTADTRNPTERLRKLKQALDEELISREEYETQRQRILQDY
ncbi:MAG: SHOCT domain-containing protein [bacterium]|nr:SHOCT domain-containing protein [bacterium]